MSLGPILSLASKQHGAVSCDQLRQLGMSWKAQRGAISAGWLTPAAAGVVVVAGSPDTWFRRLQVCLLVLGPDAWVSHEAAAALLGLDRSEPSALTFTTARGGHVPALPYGARVHTTAMVGPVDVLRVEGFRCSSATRTVLDLAASGAHPDRLGAAIDSSIRLHLSAPIVLADRLTALRGSGRAGVRLLDQLLLDTGGESVLERRFLTIVREAKLPRPQTQRRVRCDGRHVARVDFCWTDLDVVVEVTGRLGHSNPTDRTRDAQRRNELQDLGYLVYEYTWADVTRRSDYVTTTLRQRLEAAADRPGPHRSFM